ncbi:hypothetical protein LZ198_12075 [Myxococcus sp. K15C18031901]|uniref:hypothetical protein n=1 Tax=Myxococcus dinghuensis TaxID=2906761 RepID=UPI0020A7456F|nr:hypothetical protein [Myxococcus dinghuensis]MCP3099605.1 hypothetical protein [Myxococcus dinghuensis]
MARHLMGCVLAVAVLAAGCKQRSDKPIAGLLAAGAPVLRTVGKEQRPVAVGAQLTGDMELTASGPAVIEYFGGGLRFLEKGDSLEVGDAKEAKLHGANLPPRRWADNAVQETPRAQRIVAARYTNVQVTPKSAHEDAYSSTQYFVAFFTPNGLQKLGSDVQHEGPHQPLPPPPHRPKVPFIHAGDLGEGGLVATVEDGFAIAETDDLATAVLLEGRDVPLGRTVRLIVPDGSEVVLKTPDGTEVEVEGPVDLRMR